MDNNIPITPQDKLKELADLLTSLKEQMDVLKKEMDAVIAEMIYYSQAFNIVDIETDKYKFTIGYPKTKRRLDKDKLEHDLKSFGLNIENYYTDEPMEGGAPKLKVFAKKKRGSG